MRYDVLIVHYFPDSNSNLASSSHKTLTQFIISVISSTSENPSLLQLEISILSLTSECSPSLPLA